MRVRYCLRSHPFSKTNRGLDFLPRRRVNTLLLFFFHRYGDVSICGEADLVALDAGNEALVDAMMMPLVRALTAVRFRQLDAVCSVPRNK